MVLVACIIVGPLVRCMSPARLQKSRIPIVVSVIGHRALIVTSLQHRIPLGLRDDSLHCTQGVERLVIALSYKLIF